MKLSLPYRKYIFFIALINPILSLVFDNTSVYYFYAVGPVLYLLLFLQSLKNYKRGVYSLLVSFATAISVLLAIIWGATRSDLGKVNNHLFSYLDCLLILVMLSDDDNIAYFGEMIKRNLRSIKAIVFVVNVVEAYLLFTGAGYEYHYSWGGTFFHGTNSMPHTLSYLMIVVIVFICLLMHYTKNKIYAVCALIPFYAIYESGARSTLVMSLFLGLLMLDMLLTRKQKSTLIKIAVAMVVVAIAEFLLKDKIMTSDLWNKITIRQSSGNDSAGRLYIWQDLIYKYINSYNPLKYLFGQGDYMTYYYNLNNPLVGVNVWAHNDLLQILVGKGIVGLIFYIYALVLCGRNIIKMNKNIYKYTVVLMILIAALINGFYSYRDFMLGIPFMVVLARVYETSQKTLKHEYKIQKIKIVNNLRIGY